MINGKEAMVEEFALHRIGTEGAPSILSDFSAVLQGPEEQEFLRKLFLKPFSTMAQTNEFAELEGTGDNLQQGLCAKVAKGKDLVAIARAMAKQLIDQQDNFAISADAVKRQARVFKSVLKLDTNFHLYIHGDREKIERGVDESGRKYDTIYYEQEL